MQRFFHPPNLLEFSAAVVPSGIAAFSFYGHFHAPPPLPQPPNMGVLRPLYCHALVLLSRVRFFVPIFRVVHRCRGPPFEI